MPGGLQGLEFGLTLELCPLTTRCKALSPQNLIQKSLNKLFVVSYDHSRCQIEASKVKLSIFKQQLDQCPHCDRSA